LDQGFCYETILIAWTVSRKDGAMITHSVSRRSLLAGAALAAVVLEVPSFALAADPKRKTTLTAAQALAKLKAGNADFVADKPNESDLSLERRLAIAEGQEPFATIVCCSDSRVGPEQLFGAGLGELFVVRAAGNTLDIAGIGSVEYSVGPLGVPLIVVLGHEKCGAVDAAVDLVLRDTLFPGAIGDMIQPIIPAVLTAQRVKSDTSLLERSIEENVRRVVERLRRYAEPVLLEPQRAGTLLIVGAVYSLKTGAVRWLES
jgi:carbonic anhydrase